MFWARSQELRAGQMWGSAGALCPRLGAIRFTDRKMEVGLSLGLQPLPIQKMVSDN